MNTEKKYVMIVTSEDERYGHDGIQLDFFWDNPWEGLLVDIVYGDSYDELFGNGDYEGLFYQLYSTETGERIGYGELDPNSPKDEIEEFEKNKENDSKEDEPKKDWKDLVKEIANELGWSVDIDDNNNFMFERYTSCRQKFGFSIKANNMDTLHKKALDYYSHFDVSFMTYDQLDERCHGINGAPYDMSDAYDNMYDYMLKIKALVNVLGVNALGLVKLNEEEK